MNNTETQKYGVLYQLIKIRIPVSLLLYVTGLATNRLPMTMLFLHHLW